MEKLLPKILISKILLLTVFTANYAIAQNNFVKTITPDQMILQYAGSIGYISVGAGYDLFKEKTNLSFHYGYVPESKGGAVHMVAVKFQYKPFTFKLKDGIQIHPINPVIFPSYTIGENFDYEFSTAKYRKGYYFWSSALRLHLGAGSEVKIMGGKNSKIKSVSLYAEANTNDLYAISWFENRTTTPFYKMFKLGYGIKVNF